MQIETLLAQMGNRRDVKTGAVSLPIYHSTTFSHPSVGESTGYDYSRTKNPTRFVLEEEFAKLEQASYGMAFASGMAAIDAVISLFSAGDHIITSKDLYGGTYRLFETIGKKAGITVSYVETGDANEVKAALIPQTRALFIETPSNPTLRITDLHAMVKIAKEHNLLMIVDNTFMTPYCQQPLALGADIVVHSATKYLGGHNDVLAGLVATRDEAIAKEILTYQNTIGSALGPQDAWLLVRGMKTLALRMARHEENALILAQWLEQQEDVTKVYYPGLSNHPMADVHRRQASGFGGMIAFEVRDEAMVVPLLNNVSLFTYAESLGSVESLITYPAGQTHADIPKAIRESYGVTDGLLRVSVGIEHADDLIADLAQAFALARRSL